MNLDELKLKLLARLAIERAESDNADESESIAKLNSIVYAFLDKRHPDLNTEYCLVKIDPETRANVNRLFDAIGPTLASLDDQTAENTAYDLLAKYERCLNVLAEIRCCVHYGPGRKQTTVLNDYSDVDYEKDITRLNNALQDPLGIRLHYMNDNGQTILAGIDVEHHRPGDYDKFGILIADLVKLPEIRIPEGIITIRANEHHRTFNAIIEQLNGIVGQIPDVANKPLEKRWVRRMAETDAARDLFNAMLMIWPNRIADLVPPFADMFDVKLYESGTSATGDITAKALRTYLGH